MRSSVASRNRIGHTQHRPIGCGKAFEARRHSACYYTSAGSSVCRRKTGQGTGLSERFQGAKSGSHSTLRRREMAVKGTGPAVPAGSPDYGKGLATTRAKVSDAIPPITRRRLTLGLPTGSSYDRGRLVKRSRAAKSYLSGAARLSPCYRLVKIIAPTPIAAARSPPTGYLREGSMAGNKHWVGTWAAAPAPAEGVVGFNNHTLRMNPRISLGGDLLRVRISNAYGNLPVTIGLAQSALRDTGPAIVADSGRTLRFGGSDSAVIAAGAVLFSDPVELSVPPLADLAVSFHLPGEVLANFAITGRYARQTNYISPPGNFVADRVMPVGNLSDQWFFLCGVDVLAASAAAGVVALGDSLTDGNISTIDAYCRW